MLLNLSQRALWSLHPHDRHTLQHVDETLIRNQTQNCQKLNKIKTEVNDACRPEMATAGQGMGDLIVAACEHGAVRLCMEYLLLTDFQRFHIVAHNLQLLFQLQNLPARQ